MRRHIFTCIAAAILASAAAAAPPAQNKKFVSQLYQDLLGRKPSRTDSATAEGLLNLGATRTQIAGMVTSGNEYRTELIQGFYNSFLNRPASASEVNFYLTYMQQGATDDDVKSFILGSDEYFRLAGGTPHGFLNKLYEDTLGRPIDPAAEAAFATYMTQGGTRQAVASLVVHSVEADQREVTGLYQKLLHRPPQTPELNTFTQMLQTGAKDEMVVDTICGSNEYFQLAQ